MQLSVRRGKLSGATLGFALVAGLASTGISYGEEAVSVRLNWFATGYSAPFYLGVDKGWYKDAGLNVTVQESQGSVLTVQQVASGNSTFGFVSADAVLRVLAQGAPVKIVSTYTPTNGYCVMVRADSGIKSAKDLEGKTYASTAVSAIGKMLPMYLAANGVPPDSVKRISVDGTNLYAGFLARQFEAQGALSFDEPPRFNLQGTKVDCLPYADAGLKMVGQTLVTNTSMIEKHPDTVRHFVFVTLRAFEYSFDHPEEAAEAAKKLGGDAVKNTELSVAQLTAFSKLKGDPFGRTPKAEMESTIAIVREHFGIANVPTDLNKIATDEFLPN